jgi:hypothetical protein
MGKRSIGPVKATKADLDAEASESARIGEEIASGDITPTVAEVASQGGVTTKRITTETGD